MSKPSAPRPGVLSGAESLLEAAAARYLMRQSLQRRWPDPVGYVRARLREYIEEDDVRKALQAVESRVEAEKERLREERRREMRRAREMRLQEEAEWDRRARAAGFESVEAYKRHLGEKIQHKYAEAAIKELEEALALKSRAVAFKRRAREALEEIRSRGRIDREDFRDVASLASALVAEAVGHAAVQSGDWARSHRSGTGSVYLVPRGVPIERRVRVRISGHELPATAERLYYHGVGLRSFDEQIVIGEDVADYDEALERLQEILAEIKAEFERG